MSTHRPVLVHGVPETAAVWDPLVAELDDRGVTDVVRLSPPGFGSPLPDGFPATAEAYHGWLVAELEANDAVRRPVDIVGHDWGAGHVYGLVARRPDLVRTWAADIVGLLHPTYEWHDAAQAWRTPEVGEEVIAAMVSTPTADLVAGFTALGMTESIATACAEGLDADMGRAILALYRSMPEDVLRSLGADVGSATAIGGGPRGLAIHASGDGYVPAALGYEVTAGWRAGGGRVEDAAIDAGHWWMIEAPASAADRLVDHWQ